MPEIASKILPFSSDPVSAHGVNPSPSAPPRVTVAIPTFNRRQLLAETIDSVLQQDYPNLDILVSDNGSSDDTAEFVRALQRNHRNVRYRRTQAPIPVPEHFNQCIDSAEGKYFVLLSDDDRINPEFVGTLATALTENTGASAAIPSNVLIGSDGRTLRELPPPERGDREGIDFALEWLWKTKPLPVANLVSVMAPTSLMRQFGYQTFPNGLNSDNLLFLQLALSGKLLFRPEAVFYWRVHAQSEGKKAIPAAISESARSFLRHVFHDPRTIDLLKRHPDAKQKAIRDGVRFMTAEEFLHAIGFFELPFAWKTIRRLPTFRLDGFYLKLLLRHTVRRMRNRVSRTACLAGES